MMNEKNIKADETGLSLKSSLFLSTAVIWAINSIVIMLWFRFTCQLNLIHYLIHLLTCIGVGVVIFITRGYFLSGLISYLSHFNTRQSKDLSNTPEEIPLDTYSSLLLLPLKLAALTFFCWCGVGLPGLVAQLIWGRIDFEAAQLLAGGYIFLSVALSFDQYFWHRHTLAPMIEAYSVGDRLLVGMNKTVVSRLFISAGLVGLIAVGLMFLYSFFYIGLTHDQLVLLIQSTIPISISYLVLIFPFVAWRLRPVRRTLDAKINGQELPIKRITRAFTLTLRFPFELVFYLLAIWMGEGLVLVSILNRVRGFPIRGGMVLLAGLFLAAIGVGLYQIPWHRRILKPLTSYLYNLMDHTAREELSSPLNLRFKLLMSFISLVILTITSSYLTSYLQGVRSIPPTLVVIFFLVLLLISLGVVLYWARDISQPLSRLAEEASIIEGGNISHHFTPIEADEIGMLCLALEQMRLALKERMEEIQDLNINLEKKVTDRTSHLQEALQNLRQTQTQLIHSEKMASLGQLVAGVAHELNNPLSVIYNNAHLLGEYLEDIKAMLERDEDRSVDASSDPDREFLAGGLNKLLNGIRESAARARQIVADLKTFSRTDYEEMQEVNLNSSVEGVLSLLRPRLKDRVDLHVDINPLPMLKCYAGQIEQVLVNLIMNAADSLKDGGDIWITTRESNKGVTISIRDNGNGIQSEHLRRIFEPFFTTKPPGKGTGLGLSISYGIVQRHGGRIDVESEINKGSIFTIILPVGKD